MRKKIKKALMWTEKDTHITEMCVVFSVAASILTVILLWSKGLL